MTDAAPVLPAFPAPRAWTGRDLAVLEWQRTLPASCTAELVAALDAIRATPRPATAWTPAELALDSCRTFVDETRALLEERSGFVRVDRLPVEACRDAEEARTLYWLMGSLFAPPRPQYLEGHLVYDIRLTGARETDDEQAQRIRTDEIDPHTDESLLDVGPRYVSLFCLRRGRTGGLTRLASLAHAYNRVLARDPRLATRLAEPFLWQPARPTPPGAIYWHPVLTIDGGRPRFRFSPDYNEIGYRRWNRPFDAEARAALAAMDAALKEDELAFLLEPGQFVVFHNDFVTHGRTFHTDWDEPGRKRWIMRLWLGESGIERPVPDGVRAELLALAPA